MSAYYNEIDLYAAQWLRNLISAGQIAPGDVDTRSIEDVRPDDLRGYAQCHFFAGVGVWSYALRRAGWSDDRPVWTGSCPCQPFSAAGKGAAFDDERHLWPAFQHLISECKPQCVIGEQVASKDSDPWIDLVCADLETMGYAFGAVPFPSASVGAPHIRDRLYWVGVSLADANDAGLERRSRVSKRSTKFAAGAGGVAGGLADTVRAGSFSSAYAGVHSGQKGAGTRDGKSERFSTAGTEQPGPTNGYWRDADWIGCRDGKWRPVSPKPQPMVDGSSESLGRVRPEAIQEIERQINAWSMESQVDRGQAMRNLLTYLGASAKRCWTPGGVPGLHEAPFLLSFLRQLAQQGWGVAQCLPISCEEVNQASLRGMWYSEQQTGPSHRHQLEEQRAGEHPDAMPFLSSLLARYALTEWDDAYAAYAEIGFPLAQSARSRVGRLRAYGNAINAEAARCFIECVMEVA